MFEDFELQNGEITNKGFVRWEHPGVPNSSDVLRWIIRMLMMAFGHCLKCTALSGCYFAMDKVPRAKNKTDGLLHNNCDCYLVSVPKRNLYSIIEAYCPIEKFTEYIFSNKYKNGKRELFELLGFNKDDSGFLRWEYERQAKEKFLNGDYTLGNLDMFGQNINIIITLKNRAGREVEFKSGWKVQSEGLLSCNTPLGGR